MHHNHSPHPRHTVQRINAPQSVRVDAPAGVAEDGGFCWHDRSVPSVNSLVHCVSPEVCARHGKPREQAEEQKRKKTSGFPPKERLSQYAHVDAGYWTSLRQL